MGPLLDADRMQSHAGRQRVRQPFPEVHREGLAGRQPLPVGEFRQVPVDVLPSSRSVISRASRASSAPRLTTPP